MLKENDIPFAYREYRENPLSVEELKAVLGRLGLSPRDVLRTRDRAVKVASLTGDESDDRLIELMAEHPTLLQRPIGVAGDQAVVGRPVERLLELVTPG